MGIVQGGQTILDGDNVAVLGVLPQGIAAQGEQVYQAGVSWKLLAQVVDAAFPPPTLTSAIDTTGANLIIATLTGGPTHTFSDSQNNIWTLAANVTNNYTQWLYYCINPKTSTAHTFTGADTWATVSIAAFSGPQFLFDQSISYPGPQAGAITPAANNALMIASTLNTLYALSIDSGFLLINTQLGSYGIIGEGLAYLVEGAPIAVNPTWTNGIASALASFTPSPWTIVAHTSVTDPATQTPPIDTTGANLIWILGMMSASGGMAATDNYGNTYGGAYSSNGPSSTSATILGVQGTVKSGPNHIFNITGLVGHYVVLAIKAPPTWAYDNLSNNNGSAVTQCQLPSITPSTTSTFTVSVVCIGAGSISAIDSGFTIIDSIAGSPGVNYGGAVAYKMQAHSTPTAPIWTFSTSTDTAAFMLAYKA